MKRYRKYQRISEEVKGQLWGLFCRGYSVKRAADELGLNQRTTRHIFEAWISGFRNPEERKKFNILQRGFESVREYKDHLARRGGYDNFVKYVCIRKFLSNPNASTPPQAKGYFGPQEQFERDIEQNAVREWDLPDTGALDILENLENLEFKEDFTRALEDLRSEDPNGKKMADILIGRFYEGRTLKELGNVYSHNNKMWALRWESKALSSIRKHLKPYESED